MPHEEPKEENLHYKYATNAAAAGRKTLTMLYTTVHQNDEHAHKSTAPTCSEASDNNTAHECGVRGDCALEGFGTFDTGNRSVSPGFRDDTADTILLIKRLLTRQAAPPRAKLESTFLEESTPLRLDFSHHKTKRHHKTKLESPI